MRKPELYSRLLKFMIAINKKNDELWVYRSKLKDLAFDNGYPSQKVWDSFKKLDNNVQIGRIFDEGHTKYIYYDMPKKELKELQDNIDWFDSLI